MKSQNIEEITISAKSKKEIVYKDHSYYIMDFHLDSTGTFLLLNRFRVYYVYALNRDMKPEIKLQIPFHPKSLFKDCDGGLHILSKDSMYQLHKVHDTLFIGKRYSIDKYDYYYKDCQASNSEALIFNSISEYKQSTNFYQIGKYDKFTRDIYTITDSSNLRSIRDSKEELRREEERLRRKYSNDVSTTAPTWEDQTQQQSRPGNNQSTEIRAYLDKKEFYGKYVFRPNYNPLFVKDDTSYIFDHVNSKMIRIDINRNILDKKDITHHTLKKWKGEMHLDQDRDRFYSVEEIHGAQVFGLISPTSAQIIRRTKIHKHAYPEKVIVYGGYAYYVYRQNFNDNLNKLFRQKL